jgi:class 3 adenylate cyclase/tetratricopeptide (TPR) repeat protein
MTCPACSAENRAGRKFCVQCGAALALTCPACASPHEVGERFCGECGASLKQVESRQSTVKSGERGNSRLSTLDSRLASSPRSYTPKHLVDKILQSKSALEGERKQVTVLFADVKGSMELAEQLDPEEWSRIMQRFFQILSDGVERFEGFVDKFTGDGIMALFGAPIAHEDHAQRACYAALHLRDTLRRYADEVRISRALNFSVRMGLNSGEVVVGKIGDDLRFDYTAIGHTVGLAQRMEQLAAADRVYLTAHTARLVAGYFVLHDLGRTAIKGVSEPLGIHELVGVGAVRTRLDVSRARGLTRFVGRDTDLATLEAALARAREGNGQVVGVVAEAGVGKSRLCFEFLERCRARGTPTLEGRALSHTKNVPLHTILQLFRAWYGITDRDDEQTAREKIAGRLLLIDEGFREALPLQFDFLGVSDPAHPAPPMDPEARQRQIFAVLRRLVQSGQMQHGVALLEDLHWLDAASGAFLEQWVDAIAGSRNLLLLNFRPEYQADWMRRSYYQQVALAPLGPGALRELVGDLLGSDPSIAKLSELIQRRTGGNPFFAEEVVQTLVESGALEGSRGHYRLVAAVEKLAVPATVQAVLSARIDRLPEREKHVLTTAAVIGKEFSEQVLQGVLQSIEPNSPVTPSSGRWFRAGSLDTPREDAATRDERGVAGRVSRSAPADLAAALPALAEALAALERGEFVYQQAAYPVVEWAFKHPLTQEVSYGAQLAEQRRRVHGAVARAIADVHRGALDERAALLAHHWEAAGETLEAARWHARAGRWLGTRDAQAAYDHWKKVHQLARRLAADDECADLVVESCGQLFNLGFRVGAMSEEDADALFAEATRIAERRGDLGGAALLHLYYGGARTAFGDEEGRAKLVRRATELAERAGDVAVERAALLAWMWGSLFLGRLAECLEISERVLRLPPTGTAHWALDDHALARIGRSRALQLMGQLDASRREAELATTRAREREDLETLTSVYDHVVFLAYVAGDAEAALAHALRAREYQEGRCSLISVGAAQGALGLAHTLRGDWDEAIRAFGEAVAAERRAQLSDVPRLLSYLAEALLRAGDPQRARGAADEAVALAERSHIRVYECQARIARARVRLHDGPDARADVEADLARAAALVEETGARVWTPFIHAARAELARLVGDETVRQRELREAQRLFIEMGTSRRAEQIAKELGQ